MDYLPGITVLDVEATSVDTRNGAILSVGMVAHHNGRISEFYREYYPFDGAKVEADAMKVNGLDLDKLERGPENDPRNVASDVRSFMQANGCATIAGQQPCFDKDYVNAYAARYGESFRVWFAMLDSHSVCLGYMLGKGLKPPRRTDGSSSLSLDKVAVFVGLKEREGAHNALDDAELEFEALCRLVYGKSVVPRFAGMPVPEVISSGTPR